MTYKAYTGVGSRETPDFILDMMKEIAQHLSNEGFILRSGGADGADLAFESGVLPRNADLYQAKEIYLPWKGFNDRPIGGPYFGGLYNTPKEAYAEAARLHPNWFACGRGARALHARNICQVLSYSLKDPSHFLVCWTKNGLDTGGTRTAIVLAREWDIPVWNLADKWVFDMVEAWLKHPEARLGTLGELLATPLKNYGK